MWIYKILYLDPDLWPKPTWSLRVYPYPCRSLPTSTHHQSHDGLHHQTTSHVQFVQLHNPTHHHHHHDPSHHHHHDTPPPWCTTTHDPATTTITTNDNNEQAMTGWAGQQARQWWEQQWRVAWWTGTPSPHSVFISDPHHTPPPAPSTPMTQQLAATMMTMMPTTGWQGNRQQQGW